VQFEFSRFTSDHLSVGLRLGYSAKDDMLKSSGLGGLTETDVDLDTFNVGIVLKHHFMPDNFLIPYIGGQLNIVYSDLDMEITTPTSRVNASDDFTDLWYGPLLGFKVFLADGLSLFGEYQFNLFTGEHDDMYEYEHLFLVGLLFKY